MADFRLYDPSEDAESLSEVLANGNTAGDNGGIVFNGATSADRTLSTPDQASTVDFNISGGSSTTTNSGGSININAGDGAVNASGGFVRVQGGDGGSSNGTGGSAFLQAGDGGGTGNGGQCNVLGGGGGGGDAGGGRVVVAGGAATGAGNDSGGRVDVFGGDSVGTSAGGRVQVFGGNGDFSSNASGGRVEIFGGIGNGTGGNGGDVAIYSGEANGTGNTGDVYLDVSFPGGSGNPGSIFIGTGSWTGQTATTVEIENVSMNGRLQGAQGTDVASANDITLGSGNYFDITGAVTVNTIASTGWQAGSVVTLQFDAAPTVAHNTAGTGASILLAGAVNFSATAGDTLTLIYDGTTWREISRAVI